MDPISLTIGIVGLLLVAIVFVVQRQWRRPPAPATKEDVYKLKQSLDELTEKVEGLYNHVIGLPSANALRIAVQERPQQVAEAAALAERGRWQDAATRLQEAVVPLADPMVRGTLAFLAGSALYHQALEEEAAHRYPEQRQALERAAQLYTEAARLAREANQPEAEANALNNRGAALDYLGRTTGDRSYFERALADYNRSLALRLDDPATLHNRGLVLHSLLRNEEALSDYNRSLQLRPDHADTLNNRGVALAYLGRYEKAMADYNRSLALRPDDPGTLHNRGNALSDLGRYEEALADLNHSLELRPDHLDTLNNRACAYSLLNRPDEALADLEKAIALDAKYRAMARDDTDFDNIRHDPRFQALVEGDQ